MARIALRALRLDAVWLLVSPGNPLKPPRGMAPFQQRLASARAIADGAQVIATGIEAKLGYRRTERTLAKLRRRFPRARFVFVIGADNLWQLPRWGVGKGWPGTRRWRCCRVRAGHARRCTARQPPCYATGGGGRDSSWPGRPDGMPAGR